MTSNPTASAEAVLFDRTSPKIAATSPIVNMASRGRVRWMTAAAIAVPPKNSIS
ncbi:MAG TPA: hypothetical protein VH765_14910 [Xanthobacteraceae bacterium]|jgi:hypothetical protein